MGPLLESSSRSFNGTLFILAKIEELNAFRRENDVPEVKPMEYIRECFEKAMSNTDKNLKRKSDVTVKRASKSDAK